LCHECNRFGRYTIAQKIREMLQCRTYNVRVQLPFLDVLMKGPLISEPQYEIRGSRALFFTAEGD